MGNVISSRRASLRSCGAPIQAGRNPPIALPRRRTGIRLIRRPSTRGVDLLGLGMAALYTRCDARFRRWNASQFEKLGR
jgi:hypothetical protein